MVQVGTANFVHADAGVKVANGMEQFLLDQRIANVNDVVNSLRIREEVRALGW